MVRVVSLSSADLITRGLSAIVSLSSADLITRGLSAMHHVHGIRSLIGFGKRVCPLVLPVLYPREAIHDAIPKYVSERTSYRPV